MSSSAASDGYKGQGREIVHMDRFRILRPDIVDFIPARYASLRRRRAHVLAYIHEVRSRPALGPPPAPPPAARISKNMDSRGAANRI